MLKKIVVGLCIMVSSSSVWAQSTQGFTFQGRIKKPDTTLLSETGLTVNVKILSPNDCVLWDENHSSVAVTDGYLNLVVGKGTPGSQQPVGASFTKMADNTNVAKTGLVCLHANGSVNGGLTAYTPSVGGGDARKLRISTTLANLDEIVADFNLRSTPFAVNAENLSGKAAGDFVQTSANITQPRVASVYSRYATLDSILNGTYPGLGTAATKDVDVASGVAPLNASSHVPVSNLGSGTASGATYLRGDGTWASLPAATAPDWADITNKPTTFAPSAHNHNASDINAGVLPISHGGTGLGTIGNSQLIMSKSDGTAYEGFAKCADGEVLGVTSGAWDCIAGGGGGTDNTKLPLLGGTMAGSIDMDGFDITDSGHITMRADKTFRFSPLTGAQQTTLVATPLAGSHQGTVWWNSDRKALTQWSGTAVQEVPAAATPGVGQDGQSLKWNNSTAKWEFFTAGTSSGGISTIGGLSDSAQGLAVNTTGTSLTWAHGSATHTLSIPMADQTGVAAGLISKAQFDDFNGKLSALPAGGADKFMRHDGTSWSGQLIQFSDVKNSLGTSAFDMTGCGAGKTIKWSSLLDTMECDDISITKSQVSDLGTIGALAAKTTASLTADVSGVLPVANGGTGTSNGSITGTGALTFTAAGTNQDVTLTPSGTGSSVLNGKVGVGTSAPSFALTVGDGAAKDGSIMAVGYGTPGVDGNTLTVSGAGTRLFWYPKNIAFRAGYAVGTEWDNANIGLASVGMGMGAEAKGTGAVSMGQSTKANGSGSVAMGIGAEATGEAAVAMGSTSTATGAVSTALGLGSRAPAYAQVTVGSHNTITGSENATGWTAADPIFVVGNGATSAARSNAMTILKNGKVGIGETSPSHKLTISTVNEDARIAVNNWDASGAGQSASLYLGTYNITASGKPSTVVMGSFKGNASSPGNIAATDWIGSLEYFGYGGTASTVSARVYARGEGTFSNTSAPTSLRFQTTSASSVTAADRMVIEDTGNVSIGLSGAAQTTLDVNGAIRGAAFSNSNTTISFATGNLQYTSANCGGLILTNMKSGATYTLAIQGNGGGTCTITSAWSGDSGTGALTVKLGSTSLVQTATKHLLITFMVMNTTLYVASIDGY